MSARPGRFCLVLHTHLPWLAHAGAWPVGEEWLYQAWAGSYLRVVELAERLAARGRRDAFTLGLTPVLAAQLDDPYCLEGFHAWLGNWRLRAEGLARRADPALAELATHEFRAAAHALELFDTRWRHGASAVLRPLADAGVVELLGGPATHPFLPLLDERVAAFALRTGLDDARLRLGRQPAGIWAPECAYRPGLEQLYRAAGVTHVVVDGPLVHGRTAVVHDLAGSGVAAFARDLEVAYRVWSPRRGYPGGRHYRDFHTFDHPSGFRPARVTSTGTEPADKAPWDPAAAAVALAHDAADFVDVVARRLRELASTTDDPVVVAAYDTELFGHWWYEGVDWLAQVLDLLPAAGVEVSTLAGVLGSGAAPAPVFPQAGSWGSGKDWRVWDNDRVSDLNDASSAVQHRLLRVLAKATRHARRDDLDQLAREALLVVASDWAFCVSKDSAADYARGRAHGHVERFTRLADRVEAGRPADELTEQLRRVDGPFGHLDARALTG